MTVVREFFHNGGVYYHKLDLKDDSITLNCLDSGELIRYDAKCNAWVNGKFFGRFGQDYPDAARSKLSWIFAYAGTLDVVIGNSVDEVEGLLDFEVQISRRYLDTLFKEN